MPALGAACCIGVSINEGAMLFTVMPRRPHSSASAFVSVMTAPFDDAK
jgi:hypothetical protein